MHPNIMVGHVQIRLAKVHSRNFSSVSNSKSERAEYADKPLRPTLQWGASVRSLLLRTIQPVSLRLRFLAGCVLLTRKPDA